MLRYNNYSQAYKSSLCLLANKSKLVKSLKGTWRQKRGYCFELYGHEILLASGTEYKGNPIDPMEWLKDDATKTREERHADFESEDAEFEFKWNNYYLKPSHFVRDILPRFRDRSKRWILVVLDKSKCRDIKELLEYYNIKLWDLNDLKQYCEKLKSVSMEGKGILLCRKLLIDRLLVDKYLFSSYDCLIKYYRITKIRLRDIFQICRIVKWLEDTMHNSLNALGHKKEASEWLISRVIGYVLRGMSSM
jgi:hypothetical protein